MPNRKNTRLIIFSIVIIVVTLATVAVTANTNYLSRQPIGTDNTSWNDSQRYSKNTEEQIDLSKNIPLYKENELLFNTNGAFDLGRDAGVYNWLNHRPNSTNIIVNLYPTRAIREKNAEQLYYIYDTDTGYRLYLFFASDLDNSIDSSGVYLQGYPIVIKEKKSYKDFKKIAPGDSIDKVCEIDSIANLHKIQFTEVWDLNYLSVKNGGAEKGLSCVSMHYLSDGLLKINYDMLENGELVVSDLIYSKDRVITDICGVNIDYNILEQDLHF